MYAVLRSGGKQYIVREGDVVRLEKLPGEKGDVVEFKEILLLGGEGAVKTGAEVQEATVAGEILHQGRGDKILILKKRRRKHSRRRQGHRQYYTELRITRISA